MKDIRIFVASSKELQRERNYLAFLVLAHEDEFAARGLRVRLAKWEYVDPTMTAARMEDRYLDEMYNCDAALVLFRDIAGMYTREELDKALAAERTGFAPDSKKARLKTHRILFAKDCRPVSDAAKLRESLLEGSYGVWSGMDDLRAEFLSLVDKVVQCDNLVDAPSDAYVRKITAFLATDEELAEERNAFADTVLNVNDLLEQASRNIRVQLKYYDPANAESVVESSEMGLVLYGTNCRMFGRDEVKRICERVKDEKQNPKRFYVFFRNLDQDAEKSLDEAFRTFRNDFVSKLGHFACQFGDADTLRLSFLLSLERYAGESVELYSTVSAPTAPVFVGREEEIRKLCGLLEPVSGMFPAGRLPVITGAGGTGKSELVRQYASQLRVQYPGGVFQVDMEHRRTWDEAFLGILDGTPNNGVAVTTFLGLDEDKKTDGADMEFGSERTKEPMTGARVRDALLRKARETGPILLVLDNVEGCMQLFGRDGGFQKAFPSGFSERVRVNVVTTARVCDVMLRPEDWAVPFQLEDLSPDAALAILLGDRPEADAEERKAAGRVAELLGYRALYLRRVPALIGDLYAQTICDSYVELAKALEENLLETVAEETEGTHLPDVLWKMTCERLAKMPLGAECVKLAQVASFFSPDGFPKHILKYLWKTVVAPGQDERKFDRAFAILQHHNVFQSDDPVRVHRLDRAAILQTAKAESGLEEAVGKSLASYAGVSPEDWLLLADNVGILRFIPDECRFFRDGPFSVSIQTMLLCYNPGFQNGYCWDGMNICDWVALLAVLPQFADRCPWDELDGKAWVKLIVKQPQFADRCQWETLNGWDWAGLLKAQPQFADKCSWEKLDNRDWVRLLSNQPQFADKCPWGILDGESWAWLLAEQPLRFADKCPWEVLDGDAWADLLICQPQFADKCPWEKLDGENWASLLGGEIYREASTPVAIQASKGQPRFADKCPWEKLDNRDWVRLLSNQPQFGAKCPWEKLDNWDWMNLLSQQPKFIDCCQIDIHPSMWVHMLCCQPHSQLVVHCPWQKFAREDWAGLLKAQPQFADRCPWTSFDGEDWAWILADQPQFAGLCQWEKLNGRDWDSLLSEQPQFAHHCQWDKLDGRNWAGLLKAQPQFADKCPWDKLDGVDWVYLICEQPQFIEQCCQAGCLLDLPGWVLASMLCGEQRPGFDGCFRDFYEELEWIDLENLIYSQPQIAKHFPWNNLDVGDWAWLLGKKPQFADKCDWGKLDGKDWCYLLLERPEFADNCPWEKLGNDDWNSLLEEQPQFSKFKPKT